MQMQSADVRPMSWSEICLQGEYRGRWVALDGVRYDEATARPAEGTVVDADDDLAELCGRVRRANLRCCAILFCENERAAAAGRSSRPRAVVSH